MPTKDEIIKALYDSAKKNYTNEGVELSFVFADQADAVLALLEKERLGTKDRVSVCVLCASGSDFYKWVDENNKPNEFYLMVCTGEDLVGRRFNRIEVTEAMGKSSHIEDFKKIAEGCLID